MKCSQCGTEYNSNFCPECGASITHQSYNQAPQQVVYPSAESKKRKKKSFLKGFLAFILLIIVALVVANYVEKLGEKIIWEDIILGELLPEPPRNRGEIHDNSSKDLWIDIYNLTEKEFNDYLESCIEYGFTIDAKTDTIWYSYRAYNEEGYKLELDHFGNDGAMDIELEAPMVMDTIVWPMGTAGKILPVPASLIGKFSHEYDDSFTVYIGDTTREDYNAYVNKCAAMGFVVDYSKSEDSYSADNKDGWNVQIDYEGFNIMSIDIDAPFDVELSTDTVTTLTDLPDEQSSSVEASDNQTTSTVTTTEESTTIVVTTTEEITTITQATTKKTVDDGLRPDFKAAMDSYETFMTDYVDFMNKYADNPSDFSLLMDYADYMSKYAKFVEDFEAWDEEDMSDAEWAYYIDVQARVNKKLLEIS